MLVAQKSEYATDVTYARLASKVPVMSQNIACEEKYPQGAIAS